MSDGIKDSSASRMAVELGVRVDELEVKSEQAMFIWFDDDGVL